MYYTIFAKREENFLAKIDVAPLAGAWIEMLVGAVPGHKANRRSPCGSVD